eukprot:6488277-Amphidinium_carterae.1
MGCQYSRKANINMINSVIKPQQRSFSAKKGDAVGLVSHIHLRRRRSRWMRSTRSGWRYPIAHHFQRRAVDELYPPLHIVAPFLQGFRESGDEAFCSACVRVSVTDGLCFVLNRCFGLCCLSLPGAVHFVLSRARQAYEKGGFRIKKTAERGIRLWQLTTLGEFTEALLQCQGAGSH